MDFFQRAEELGDVDHAAAHLDLLAGPEENQSRMAQAREALQKSHHAYDIVAYEGGPSGYALPGRDSPEQKLANEKYGKSLAMAVAALDAWMRSYQYGWTYQNFLGYGQGLYWNSHTPLRLRLPFRSAGKITLHKLAGDPRASNRTNLVIAPQSQDIPPDALTAGTLTIGARTGGGSNGLPPGSVLLYVFERTGGK